MKNQYFGDVNDYRKYGLLRILSGYGELSTGVCWMLTPPDGRTDGKFLGYLDQPAKWKNHDPDLYDFLYQTVSLEGKRSVDLIERSDILPNTMFHSDLLSDGARARKDYFENVELILGKTDLIFFDPDNGFEVKSKKYGCKDSSKYLFWHEFDQTYAHGHSVLVYQHFTREKREDFISRTAEQIKRVTGCNIVFSYRTAHVVFFLASQDKHSSQLERNQIEINKQWTGQIHSAQH